MTTPSQPLNRLPTHWLRLAQVMWIVIMLTATSMFLAGIPFALTAFSQVGSFVTPETMAALQNQGIPPQQYALMTVISLLVYGLIGVTVGSLIFVRKSADPLALITSLALVTFGTQTGLRGSLAEAVPALSLPHQILSILSWVLLPLFFALFPNGKFVPRWLRWPVLAWALLFILSTTGLVAFPEAAGFIFLAFWLICLSAQIYRYLRVSIYVERQQTKWVALGFILLFAIYIPLFILVLLIPEQRNSPYLIMFGNFIIALIPLSIGIAVLKSRLWDIDIIIRKTVQYAVLTLLLGLIYFGSIILLQTVVGRVVGEQSPLVIVFSTLLIAALFNPLRRRVQTAVDRRFYRQKYDAQQVLAQFAQTARDEVEMEVLQTELLKAVQESLQPETISIWLKR